MERNGSFGKWVFFSAKNEVMINEKNQEEIEEEEEEEGKALSLSDLPIVNEENQSRKEDPKPEKPAKTQDDFDFCSLLQESEMVSADEVFFQGQILPLRHSMSSESAMDASRSNSRSESERSNSSGFTSSSSCRSSRSSSIRSNSNGSSTNTPIYKPRMRNQFHSHPSPKPQIKFSNVKTKIVRNSNQKSTMWSHFRLGLLTTPEIALHDLKSRTNNVGSRNSTSSSSSNVSNGSNTKTSKKKKNGALFGGCKCTIDAVETIHSKIDSNHRKSVSRNDEEVDHLAVKETNQKQNQEGKEGSSRNRTFEWLKQLSLDEPKIENL